MSDKKPLKNPKGGLTAAGRKAFGGNLKPGVKNYSKASTSDKKRWISWALRFYGQDNYPPLKDEKGRPTRFALTAAAWGEPVPQNEAEARAIAAKARKRKQELADQELAQSNIEESLKEKGLNFLEHAGVKGMKWGVRKERRQIKKTNPARRKVRKADKKWEKKATKSKTIRKIYNKSGKEINANIKLINEKPQYKNKNISGDPKLLKKYNDEMSAMATQVLNKNSEKMVGSSRSKKTLQFKYDVSDTGLTWKVVEGNVRSRKR
jgi:hypothetical protein